MEAPDQAAVALREVAAAGATIVNLNFRHRSRQHYLEQLAAMAEIAKDV